MTAAVNGARAPLSPEERTKRAVAATIAETAAPRSPNFTALAHSLTESSEPAPSPAEERADHDRAALPYLIREGAPVDVWVATADGFRRWRPIIDRLVITPLPGGARLLEIGRGLQMRFDADQAAHLARLLLPEPQP